MKNYEEIIKSKLSAAKQNEIVQMAKPVELAISLISRLRAPEGCPWDREQTHQTLRQYLIEEAYEVLDVLDETVVDKAKLKEELGDLFLQVLLHSELCAEKNQFNFGDVCTGMVEKLVSRHPHVFGDVKIIGTSEEVLKNWEIIKKKEGKKGLLDGLPKNLPSLQKAARIGEKAHRVGFDWQDYKGPLAKVDEELGELKEAISKGLDNKVEIEDELGDLFFSLCNLSRFLKITPEDAHRKAIQKFENRFRKVEAHFNDKGQELHTATFEELDAVWEQIKKL